MDGGMLWAGALMLPLGGLFLYAAVSGVLVKRKARGTGVFPRWSAMTLYERNPALGFAVATALLAGGVYLLVRSFS